MAYKANIPAAADLLSVSQGDLLENFSQLNTQFGVDHDALTTPGDGFHKKVTIPVPLGSDPSPAGTAGQVYTKDVSGVAQLFFANSAGVQTLTPISSTQSTNGTMTLPNGVTLKWGNGTSTGSTTVITYVTPFLNNVFGVYVQRVENTTIAYPGITINLLAGFNVYGITTAHTFYYLAIGN